MIAKDLYLKNFRNYCEEKIEFSPSVNIIYGNNAQGKTNILEGVYLFSMGKSVRTHHDEELIKIGEKEAYLNMNFSGGKRDINAEMFIKKNNRKRFLMNEIPVKRNSDLVGKFNVVYFGPECMNIIKSGPMARRKNLDILISQLKKNYFICISDYKKTLEAKTALLKNEIIDKITLDILNERLINLSTELTKYRFLYIKKIENIARKVQKEISQGKEKLEIKYSSFCGEFEEFVLSDSISIIPDCFFHHCYNLKRVFIPNTITDIRDAAFEFCTSLEEVYYGGSEAEWKKINIGNGNGVLDNVKFIYGASSEDMENAG